MLASLPMYDWPEVREHTDALWSAIRTQLLVHGIDAPCELQRDMHREHIWRAGDLLLSQTCGLPYTRGLCGDALLLGSPVYDLEQCAAGDYYSVVVVRNGDRATSLQQLRGRAVAFNAPDSQSGHAALLFAIAPLAGSASFFAAGIEVGTHRAAIAAVADGEADVAAIDAVSWRLAVDHEPAARKLRILAHTATSPGLPLITGHNNAALRAVLNDAIGNAIGALAQRSCDALHLRGFRPRPASDYAVLQERIEQARRLGCTQLH
jgi:ABC-type phosphate/phosphonate transport system substrate-binding protein